MLRASAVLFAAVLAGSPALAQDSAANYPDHPIRIVVCVPAGGGVDTVTRMLADGLQKKLGQPVVVENRGGAGGNIGADYVYQAKPDGYTLLAAQPAPLTINPLLYKKIAFDPTRFEPIAVMSAIPNVLLVRTGFPAATVKELVAYAKAHPGKINYASQGIGTTSHLTAALFEKVTGIRLVHVPYKGTSPALNDLIAGHVDMIFMELSRSIQLHKAGRAHILAVATKERIQALPDIPTLIESGVNIESGTWNAIVAPPKTPAAIAAKLSKAVNEVLKEPAIVDRLKKLSLSPVGGTPASTKTFIAQETKTWGNVIREAHVPAH